MKIHGAYDEECDVLYVSMTDPPLAEGVRSRSAHIIAIVRTDANGKLAGLTIESAQYQAERARDAAP